jgi:DNA polymerase-3 subunit gamma/tau
MGQALYRKYRPQKMSEVVGQEHITTTLSHALKNNNISHAYLFSGPRGVGKTSVARIWAHNINGIPYNEDDTHSQMDIIEIDAASNRRIDEIRELRDKVYVAPTTSKYKVYIIDEVHMLTKEAFNALLKTLEEPPAHAVFILATTDSNKLPDTIISRTQKHVFKPVNEENLSKQLSVIAGKENITIDPKALQQIAKLGKGSFRDSISMLDQLRNTSSSLTLGDVTELLGIPTDDAISSLVSNIYNESDSSKLIKYLDTLINKGFQANLIAEQMIVNLRNQYISNSPKIVSEKTISLMDDLLKVNSATNQHRYLEIILLKYSVPKKEISTEKIPEPKKTVSTVVENISTVKTTEKDEPVISKDVKTEKPNITEDDDVFSELLIELKKQYNTLYSILRMAEHNFYGNKLELNFTFPFHYKKISEENNKKIISKIMKDLTGSNIKIICNKIEKTAANTEENQPVPKNKKNIEGISNIFGSAELLES